MVVTETVLVVGQNLFFLPRIQNVAAPVGFEVRRVATESTFWDNYREAKPALVLVDLEGDRDTWTRVVEGLGAQGEPRPNIVAFGPHADVAVLELARKLGCDAVLTKGEFSDALQQIVESRGAAVGT